MKREFTALTLVGAAILMLLFAEGCASIGNPSGGPRDERPPRFVKADPAPGSVNIDVTRDKFRIAFDELVDVKDPTTKVIISPPGASIPRVSAQGHNVLVNFQDSLAPNTTYTIDFADAIQDINENNPITNFSYTFSTGPDLDTLRIAGRVLSAREMEPMQLKLVGLHRLPDSDSLNISVADSLSSPELPSDYTRSIHRNLFSKKFDRVGRTDDRGRFSIEGLSPGRYRVYALDDVNSDYIFSNSDEEVAFYDVVVSPSVAFETTTDSIFNLKAGRLDTVVSRNRTIFLPNDVLLRSALSKRKQQYIESYTRVDSTRLDIVFHAPAEKFPHISIVGRPDSLEKPYITQRSRTNDTISLWLSDPTLISTDTIRLAVDYQVLDSLQRYVVKNDTLRYTTDRTALKKAQDAARKLIEKQKKQQKKNSDADKDTITESPKIPLLNINIAGSTSQDIGRPLRLTADAPLANVDTSAFRLEVKIDTLWRPFSPPVITSDSLNPKDLIISGLFAPATEYRLSVDSLALKSIYGLHNARLEHNFRVKAEDDYCSLTLRLADWPSATPAFVELLNGSDKPVAVAPVSNSIAKFPYLYPGKYYARIIHDINANGRWDSGDPLINLQPEEAYYYPKAINIKKNWNKDESWTVFAIAADTMKPETLLQNKPAQDKNRRKNQNTPVSDEEEEDEE